MKRTILSVISGIAIGALAVAWFSAQDSPHTTVTVSLDEDVATPTQTAVAPNAPQDVAAQIAAGTVTTRSSTMRLAAASDDKELRGLIETIASGRSTQEQQLALSLLFARLADVDVTGAIEALGLLDEPRLAEAMALDILDVIGADEFNIARVLSELPRTDPMAFRVEAIARLTARAPAAALQLALQSDDRSYRYHAVRRVARNWAREDPAAALRSVALIDEDELGNVLRNEVSEEWARVDPDGLLNHLLTMPANADRDALFRSGGLRVLADSYPLRMLQIVDSLPAPYADSAQRIAVWSWAETDPLAAFAYAESQPPGEQRQRMRQQVATAFASKDPDGALLWLDTLGERDINLSNAVLQGVAQLDPDRALEVVLGQQIGRSEPWPMQGIIIRIAMSNPDRMPEFADSVLAYEDERRRTQALRTMMQAWARSDASGALEWTLRNAESLPAGSLREAASWLGREDPTLAMQFVDRVPPQERDFWIESVAGQYAQFSRDGAIEWLSRFRGQSVYMPAMLSVARGVARDDPAAAASILTGLGALPEDSAGTTGRIVRFWAETDAAAARRFTLNLARGQPRDAALSALLSANDNTRLPDAEMAAAFSSDLAREQALLAIINNVARDDTAAAYRMVDEHLSNPSLQQQADQMIERTGRR